MSNATNLSKLANLLDDGTSGQALVSDGASNVAFETLSTSNVSEGTNLYFTDERVQTKLGSVSGNVVPDTNVAYDLGSAAYAFKDLYLSGSTINLGSLQLSDNGGSLEVSPTGGGSAEPFATETYVTTQVNNLVDAAPGTLDTLNELAAALGDDANFSTTVTNSIAAKANTASLATVATSGSFSDLTGKPTTIAGYGITDAGSGGGGNVVEYNSSSNASVNDVVMLNSNGTVTPIEVTTYKTNKDVPQAQIIPNSTGWVYNQTNGAYDQSSDNAVLFPLGITNKYFFMGRDDSSGTAELSGAIVDWTGTSTNSGSWSTWNNPGWTYGTKYSGQSGFGGFARPALSDKEKPFVLPSPLDANKFLLVQRVHDSEKVVAQVGTITGSTVAWSNHTELDIVIHWSSYVRHLYDPANSSSGNYAFYTVVNSDSSGRVRIVRGVWDGNTTITFGPGTSSGDHNGWQFPSDAIDPRSISFSKITANRCAAVNRTTGDIAIYDLSTTINSTTSAVTKGTTQPLSSFQWDGTDLPAHTSWSYNRDEFVAWWRTAGNTQDNNSIMQNYELSSTNPVYPVTKGTNLNLANHIQFKNGDFESISGSDVIFTTYLQEWSGLGGEHSHRAVISIDASSGNLTTLDKDIAYSHSTGEPGVFTLANTNNAQFEGTISVDHFRKGQAVMTNPHYNNSAVWQVAGSPIVGTYVQSNIDATKIHGLAATSGTTIDVTVEGGIHTGLSGLTAGTTYFVIEDGSISATADTHNARLGIAMTSTSLAVDRVNELTDASLATYATKSYVGTEIALKANTADLSTVATSGSYNDLTNQPTIPTNNNQLTNGAGFIRAVDVPNDNVVEYTSTTSASINDVVMLNTDGTVTPVETITYTDSLSLGGEYLVQENNGWSSSSTDVTNSLSIASRPGRIFPTGIDNKFILAGYDGISTNNQEAVAVIDWTGSQWSYGQKYVVGTEMGGNSSYFSVAEQSAPFILGSLVNTSKFLYFQKRQEAFSGGQYTGDFAYGLGTISGSTISWTSATDTGFGYDSTWNEKIIYDFAGSSTGNYKFIIMYTRDSGSGTQLRLVRGTWDGTSNSVSFSNEITISRGIDPRGVGFSSITEGRFAAVSGSLDGGPQAGDLEIFDVDWDNGTYTVGNAVTPASIYTGSSMPAKVAWNPTNDTFVVAWLVGGSGGSNVDNLRYRTYEANGTTPSTYGSESNFGEDRFEFANGDFTFLSGSSTLVHTYIRQFTQFSSTHDAGYIRSMNVASNGTITSNQETQTSNLGNYGSATHVRDNGWRYEGRIVVDPHRKGMGTRLDPRTNNSTADVSKWVGMNIRGDFVESSLDATKLHGIADSSGTIIDVSVDGSIHNQLTGLIADQVYYVLEDGTLSTTPDTHNARVGVSLSNTAIKVSLSEKLTSTDLVTYATKSYVGTETAIKANTADLATVATSGSYNDLTNQPTIPSLSGYATETYVNTATANLVDSAPATLNTLNELAAALGDDANFSTTILAQLGAVSANTISNASNINAVQANLSASASTAAVTVSGGNFYIDGAQQTTISLEPGRTYKFDQSDSTNSSHPLRFSTTSDGTHGGGSEYTTGVTTSGTAGSANAYVQIAIDNSTPALYYYCTNHSGMGAAVSVGNPFNTDELSEGTSNLYYTDARVDARISGGVSANLNITSSPTKKYARLELTANQSINSQTNTILNYNTRSEDNSTANLLTTTLADGKFIIPAGVTKVRLKASAEGSNVTEQFLLKIMKNGSNAVTTNFDIASTGSDHSAAFTGIENVVEGDYFQVSGYSESSRTVSAGSFTWFELEVLEGSILDTTVSANVALADLNNVSNAAPADGQALIWNTSQSNWAPANVAAGGSSVSVSDTAPSSPSNGDQWFNSADGSMYIYYADGSSNQWVSVSGPAGSSVSVGTTPPTGAANGDQWFNSDSATLYVYYADGSSSQWVAVSGPAGPQGPASENSVTTGKAIAMSIVFG